MINGFDEAYRTHYETAKQAVQDRLIIAEGREELARLEAEEAAQQEVLNAIINQAVNISANS